MGFFLASKVSMLINMEVIDTEVINVKAKLYLFTEKAWAFTYKWLMACRMILAGTYTVGRLQETYLAVKKLKPFHNGVIQAKG